MAAWLGGQIALVAAAWAWLGGDADSVNLTKNALVIGIVTLGGAPAAVAVIMLAARSSGCGIAEYLALRWPERRQVMVGLVTLAALIPLVDLLSWLAGHDIAPAFVTNLYRSGRDTGTLPLLVLGMAGAAPLVEELLFRGLLLPGLAATRLGPAGAIGLTSVGWALMHLQYQPFYLIQAVAMGVLFGWLRWRSGSTLLSIVVHALVNLISLLQAFVIVEWLR